jgi:hypothetical protein
VATAPETSVDRVRTAAAAVSYLRAKTAGTGENGPELAVVLMNYALLLKAVGHSEVWADAGIAVSMWVAALLNCLCGPGPGHACGTGYGGGIAV